MVITLVIEGNKEDLHTLKGNIVKSASECLVSCQADIIEKPKKELKVFCFN